MKIVIILYIIGIVVYWLGILNFIHVAKRNWNDVDESLKDNARKRSKASCNLTLNYMVTYSGSKFCYGIFVHFQPILFLEEVKKKGSREIYCLFL